MQMSARLLTWGTQAEVKCHTYCAMLRKVRAVGNPFVFSLWNEM